jgi:S-adenosylmethionine synthetase
MAMYPPKMFFTSESVTEGHPDKLCDQVSDAVLDACLKADPDSRVACNTYVTMGMMLVGGEITTRAMLDVDGLVRQLGHDIGYTSPRYGYDVNTIAILRSFHPQSPDIAQGVSRTTGTFGAGDQGMMFGYACRQTEELMPLPIMLANRLAMLLAQVRKQQVLDFLGPDGKTQVTVEYRDGKPARVDYVVIACQHTPDVVTPDGNSMTTEAQQQVIDAVVCPVLGDLVDDKTKSTVNGTGKFVIGGPQADTGLTGHKIIIDTYGDWAVHGGGAFSGKDPTKVDRCAGTWRATWPRMSSPRGWPMSASCSLPTALDWRSAATRTPPWRSSRRSTARSLAPICLTNNSARSSKPKEHTAERCSPAGCPGPAAAASPNSSSSP